MGDWRWLTPLNYDTKLTILSACMYVCMLLLFFEGCFVAQSAGVNNDNSSSRHGEAVQRGTRRPPYTHPQKYRCHSMREALWTTQRQKITETSLTVSVRTLASVRFFFFFTVPILLRSSEHTFTAKNKQTIDHNIIQCIPSHSCLLAGIYTVQHRCLHGGPASKGENSEF